MALMMKSANDNCTILWDTMRVVRLSELNMSKIRERLLTSALVLSFGIGCDQTTKRIAELTLTETAHSFLFDTFRLQFIKNSGAFLGFGSQFSPTVKCWLFLLLPIVFLAVALTYLLSSKLTLAQNILVSLMISGGIGNLIDRILLSGLVTDFLNVGIGPIRTGIFNVADMAIMAGAFGLLFVELKKSKKTSPETP